MALKSRSTLFPCVILTAALVSACGASRNPEDVKVGGVYDPYEGVNRGIHSMNKSIDRAFFGPASKGYTDIVPDELEDSFVSFSENVSMPRVATNALLQADAKTFGIAVARFTINTTIGFMGLADPATEFGLERVDADFGETLHVWGFGEGAYNELPFLGPSNNRDTVGFVADFFLNPLSYYVHNPIDNVGVYSKGLEWMTDRGRFSDTIESVLYESADSYAQARLLYVQNRRFELEDDAGGDYLDPYADPYGDPYADPYSDTYEDPYAE